MGGFAVPRSKQKVMRFKLHDLPFQPGESSFLAWQPSHLEFTKGTAHDPLLCTRFRPSTSHGMASSSALRVRAKPLFTPLMEWYKSA